MKRIIISLILILMISLSIYSYSIASNLNSRELLRSVVQQSRTQCEEVDILMTLVDKDGKEWDRTGRFYTQRKDDKNDMRLFYFFTPPELANSGILTIENSEAIDDQWIYVPAYHTIRRIAGGNRSEKYMGTDFFYEDIMNVRVEEYNITELKRETLQSIETVVLQVIPISKRLRNESAYSKTLWWIDPGKKVTLRIEYYDKSGDLFKILQNLDLQMVRGYYLWEKQIMEDVHKNHKTIIEYKNRKVDESIQSNIFTVRYLKRKK